MENAKIPDQKNDHLQALFQCVHENDLQGIEQALDRNVDVFGQVTKGETLLLATLKHGDRSALVVLAVLKAAYEQHQRDNESR